MVLFVGAIWAIYFVSLVFPGMDQYGVIPRRLGGLAGIAAMPFLHANLQHLLGNTVPLVVLLILLAGSRAESWEVVVIISAAGRCFALDLWPPGRAHRRQRPDFGPGGFLDPFRVSRTAAHPAVDRAFGGIPLRQLAHPGRHPPDRLPDLVGRPPLRRDRRRPRGVWFDASIAAANHNRKVNHNSLPRPQKAH